MIRVNLLPHREEKRKARRQQFYALSGLVVVLAGVMWFLGFSILSRAEAVQEQKNEFLKKEIAALDKDIAEIKQLKEQTEILLSRNRVIESLQATRTETVHFFTELAKQTPEGTYLKSAKQTGRKITLNGLTQANARVSEYMHNLEASPLLGHPVLIEIKAAGSGPRRLSEFSLTVDITTQQSTAGDKKDAPKVGAKK